MFNIPVLYATPMTTLGVARHRLSGRGAQPLRVARLVRLVIPMRAHLPMPLMSIPHVLVSAALLTPLLGCSGSGDGSADNERRSTAAPSAISPREPQNGRPEADTPICLQGERFAASGPVPIARRAATEREASAAPRQIAGLRWERHDGCERFVIDLAGQDGDPPAGGTAGDVRAELLRDTGVLRVTLRDVPRAHPDATDARFDGPLARSAYVVKAPDGPWTYLDLHLGEPAEAHILVLQSPARVVVDLRPGGGPTGSAAAMTRRVVVLKPAPGPARYPLTVTGYARTFEANVVARLEQSGNDVHESFTTATAWVDAWGYYSLTIDDGPSGPTRLHVGEYSARDGSWEGATIDLDLGPR